MTGREEEASVLEAEEAEGMWARMLFSTPIQRSPSYSPYPSAKQLSTHLLDCTLQGRNTEFGTLIDHFQRVHTGQPHLLLLQGESGIGKTCLANEFVGWAQAQGAHVMIGRALHTERQLPYQPFVDILRHRLEQEHAPDERISDVWLSELFRLLPELHERFPNLPVPSTDEEFGHHRLFEEITRIIRRWAAHHPLMLLLDDMQWADTGTRV